eukprot:6365412-Heterocapsa_arctica.AAC.1
MEAAFPGGAFHPALIASSPIYREALRNTFQVNDVPEPYWLVRDLGTFPHAFDGEDLPVKTLSDTSEMAEAEVGESPEFGESGATPAEEE